MSYQYPETPFVLFLHEKFVFRLILAFRDVPEGWMACRHPEGALYFVHVQSVRGFDLYDDVVSQTRIRRKQ